MFSGVLAAVVEAKLVKAKPVINAEHSSSKQKWMKCDWFKPLVQDLSEDQTVLHLDYGDRSYNGYWLLGWWGGGDMGLKGEKLKKNRLQAESYLNRVIIVLRWPAFKYQKKNYLRQLLLNRSCSTNFVKLT